MTTSPSSHDVPDFDSDEEWIEYHVSRMPMPSPETCAHLARLLGIGEDLPDEVRPESAPATSPTRSDAA